MGQNYARPIGWALYYWGKAYIILGLHFIERFALGNPYFLEVRRGEARCFFELGR